MSKVKFTIISLFSDALNPYLNTSMMWKAKEKGIAEFDFVDLREFGLGAHKSVDDTPYGGGDGMLLKPEPFFEAIKFAKEKSPNALVIAMTPSKTVLTQKIAENFANEQKDLIIICGHYEGFDERIFTLVDQKISIGQFVLTGGELPAMVLIDAVVRLLPNVLGGEDSALIESYSDGDNIEFPQYTRPAEYQGLKVPEVLLSGHHANIDKWRKENYR